MKATHSAVVLGVSKTMQILLSIVSLCSLVLAQQETSGALATNGPEDLFTIESDFGEEAAWVEEYLERVHAELVVLMENPDVPPPRDIAVEISADPDSNGVGGYATPTSLGFSSNEWPRDRYRLWIMAHELVNLFAAHYGGSGGYPGDWWSDDRSPFPIYVAWLVVDRLGEQEAAAWLRGVARDQRDQQLFWRLHEDHGFGLFADFFKLIRADGIDIGEVGERDAAWPAPDPCRTAWTIAYLSMAAGENLAPLFREFGIGSEPSDWWQRHPEIAFREYSVSDEQVEDVVALRELLFTGLADGRAVELLRDAYRRGEPWRAGARAPAGVAPEGVAADGIAEDVVSPIEFVVESEFGTESAWTRVFLGKAAAAVGRLLGDGALALPARVTVVLSRDPDVGGVGGGSTADRIELISDQWPQEPFRLWILGSELGVLLGHHLGGALPADWFGHDNRPFATYLSALALEQTGHAEEAAWVRDMHQQADHQLLWTLHEEHGFALFARFFELLRGDAVDFQEFGLDAASERRERSLHIAAYLSVAAGSNLAPLFRRYGIGRAPDPAPADFEPYELTDAAVQAIIDRRGMLIGGK